jgi:hypothetical protein
MAVIILNRPFPISPNPQAGDIYLGVDPTDGHIKTQNSAGLVEDYRSGAVYTDADAVNAIKTEIAASTEKTRLSPLDKFYIQDSLGGYKHVKPNAILKRDPDRFFNIFSDFLGTATGDFIAFQAGTGASSQSGSYGNDLVENAIGVTQSDTGTTSTGRAGLGMAAPASLRPTAARFLYRGRHAIEAVSTLTETFVMRIGLTDSYFVAGDGTNGLFFRYTDLQNGGRWEAVSRAGGTDLIAVDTGVAPDLDYHVYQVELDENGQQARFHIDGNLVATINSPNLPGPSNALSCGFKIEKTVGTAQRNMDTDYLYFELERTNLR